MSVSGTVIRTQDRESAKACGCAFEAYSAEFGAVGEAIERQIGTGRAVLVVNRDRPLPAEVVGQLVALAAQLDWLSMTVVQPDGTVVHITEFGETGELL